MKVICPRCGKETEYNKENPYRPFCSKRCKDSDLFGWLAPDEDEAADDDSRNGNPEDHLRDYNRKPH